MEGHTEMECVRNMFPSLFSGDRLLASYVHIVSVEIYFVFRKFTEYSISRLFLSNSNVAIKNNGSHETLKQK